MEYVVILLGKFNMSDIIFKNKRSSITSDQFKTLRKTYMISKIEKIELKYSFLFLLPISIFLLMMSNKYSLFLYDHEIISIYIFSVFSIIGSLGFGVIQIHTKTMQETAIMGFLPELKKIRHSLDEAMFLNENKK